MTIQLRRYTNVTVLVDMLVNQRISLISPDLWDDPNDSRMIDSYKDAASFGFVGAACLTSSLETFHHWKLFAKGMSGICIEFDPNELKRYILPHSGLRMKEVQYLRVSDVKIGNNLSLSDMPFFKRIAFSAEKEVRIIYESRDSLDIFHVGIDVSCFKRIVTSPFMPENLHHSLKRAIWQLPFCGSLRVDRSRLFDSKTWQKRWSSQVNRYRSQ